MAGTANLNEKYKIPPSLVSTAEAWNIFLYRSKVNEVCVCGWNNAAIASHHLKLGPLWMRQGLKPPMIICLREYTNIKTKVGDVTRLYKYKSGLVKTECKFSLLVILELSNRTILLCQPKT